MSEGNEKGIAQKLWDKTAEWWPVSILLMTFTFLSQLDKVMEFSAYLSYALAYWREGLHWAVTLIPHFIFELLDLEWRIESPVPELLFLFSCIAFTGFRSNKLSDVFDTIVSDYKQRASITKVFFGWLALLLKKIAGTTYSIEIFDKTFLGALLGFFYMWIILFPFLLISTILLLDSQSTVIFSISMVAIVFMYIFLFVTNKDIFFNFMVLICSGMISISIFLIGAAILIDLIIPPSQGFVCAARTRGGLSLPEFCS